LETGEPTLDNLTERDLMCWQYDEVFWNHSMVTRENSCSK